MFKNFGLICPTLFINLLLFTIQVKECSSVLSCPITEGNYECPNDQNMCPAKPAVMFKDCFLHYSGPKICCPKILGCDIKHGGCKLY
ncbi:hypothetical protein ACQ4LE_007121 [Meloidogyne hapla]